MEVRASTKASGHSRSAHSRPRMETACRCTYSAAARAPIVIAGTEVTIVRRAVNYDRSAIHPKGGIKAPTERAIEDSISRNERIRAEPGIPVPAGAEPSRSAADVGSCHLHIGFGEVAGSQACPAIEIILI